MINVRPAAERGTTRIGWLDSRHTFAFGEYYDPKHMGFRALRVINDDRVLPAAGFGTHGHKDMEIVSYVLEGALEHKDSIGTGSVLRPGTVQRMSAGRGVYHSEWNPSKSEGVHFLQIWILPQSQGIAPSYEEKHFPVAERQNGFRLLVSPDARDGSVKIHQDAEMWGTVLDGGKDATFELRPGRRAWIQVARGALSVNGTPLGTGDGAAIEGESRLSFHGVEPAEVLLFDLA
jgi:redox-sensitive bicupin YhaK (pirin superfamily)